jgi:uncharacterized protein (DUF1697 family)
MPVFIAFIRGINVGGRNMLKMDALRALCADLGYLNVQTLLQSGNVVFRSSRKDANRVAVELRSAIRESTGLDVRVMVRTPEQLQSIIDANPFPEHAERDPSHLLVTFLGEEPAAAAKTALRDACSSAAADSVHLGTKELYAYYENGMIESKLSKVPIEKKLGVAGTARNWNTVTKLLELAEACK